MIIDTPIIRIEAVLSDPVTTNELPIAVSYSDGKRIRTAEIVFLRRTITTGTTDVTILTPPSNTEKRLVKNLTVCNLDTVEATIELKYDDDLTETCIIKVTLQPNDTLQFTEEEGFRVIDANGGMKTVDAGVFGAPSQSIDIGDPTVEGVSVNHTRADHQHAFPAPGSGYPVNSITLPSSDGVNTTPARSDHRHEVTTGVTPSSVDIGDVADEGTSVGLAHGSHIHQHPAPPLNYPVNSDAGAEVDGIATTPARSDHKHQVDAAVPTGDVDIGDVASEGVAAPLTRADHQHAHPAPPPSYPTSVDIGDAQVDGVATTPARSDHEHAHPAPPALYPEDVADIEADGVATTPARSDHVHSHGISTLPSAHSHDDLSGVSPDDHHNQVHSDADHTAGFGTPTADIDIGDSGVEGVATTHSRSDHQHPFPAPLAGYPLDVVALESDGVATTPARSDHVHRMGILTTKGDLLVHNGTDPVRFAVGTLGQTLVSDPGETTGIKWSGGLAILALNAGNQTVVNTIVETTIFSFTIPGLTLATQNIIRVSLIGSVTDNTGGGAETMTFRFKYGSTTLGTVVISTSTGTSDDAVNLQAMLMGDGTASSQLGNFEARSNGDNPNDLVVVIDQGTAVEDSTGDLDIVVTVELGAADPDLQYDKKYTSLEVLSE